MTSSKCTRIVSTFATRQELIDIITTACTLPVSWKFFSRLWQTGQMDHLSATVPIAFSPRDAQREWIVEPRHDPTWSWRRVATVPTHEWILQAFNRGRTFGPRLNRSIVRDSRFAHPWRARVVVTLVIFVLVYRGGFLPLFWRGASFQAIARRFLPQL